MATPGAARPRLVGAVLVGGASRRMGSDKSLLEVGGRRLGARATEALRGAGVEEVLLVGGTDAHAVLDGEAVTDLWPGEGPVGGVLTALHEAFLRGAAGVVCLACDLPSIDVDAVTALIGAADAAWESARAAGDRPGVVVVDHDGRWATPNGVWPVAALPAIEDRFGEGADSFVEALDGVAVSTHPGGAAWVDADEPGDIAPFL